MIEKDQVYEAIKPNIHGERVRIKVTTTLGGTFAGVVGVSTVGANGKLLRPRSLQTSQLHEDMLTKDGKPRRNGYVLVVEP
jgi:hypothetical protein